MCGYGEKVDRRPIDPPPVVQLFISPHSVQSQMNDVIVEQDYASNPNLFVSATLCDVDTNEELNILKDGKTRSLTGSTVSSLFKLRDESGEIGAFFVFYDLSVRMEGVYRLKFSLFGIDDERITFYKNIYSRSFNVHSAKKFPGMGESSALSKTFAEQGIKMRIRKEARQRKRRLSLLEASQDEEENDRK